MALERRENFMLRRSSKAIWGSLRARKPLVLVRDAFVLVALIFVVTTLAALKPVEKPFREAQARADVVQLIDRNGVPLSTSYQSRWNTADKIPLYDYPALLKQAFIISEDRKFYQHQGVDWRARAAGLWLNIKTGERLRGSSTITEQVVRMINPRPRTLWSKWVEGIEATILESKVAKADILEFYLNQVPYAAGRRGVAQAAHYYFARDLDTLTPREMLALVVLARAPSAYDLFHAPGKIDKPLERLASDLDSRHLLTAPEEAQIGEGTLHVAQQPPISVYAQHLVRYIRSTGRIDPNAARVTTTLDAALQNQVQAVLDRRVRDLEKRNVHNGAALVMDYKSGDVLAWVVAGAANPLGATPAGDIDAVTTPRQPGSAMKPFLYARALDKGWSAATLLDDSALAEAVGTGLHRFRNYSGTYYGPITLREALGNSLNIPALLTIRHVGVDDFLSHLRRMEFTSLTRSADIYDEGLALGNGEVSLLEMVKGYAALANNGEFKSPHFLRYDEGPQTYFAAFTPETSAIMGNILSDPWARRLEFGKDSILNFRQQTAVKTGTSTDYKDAWVFGYNDRYVVGIWMGNMDRTPMEEVTGSTGPALALRSIMTILNKNRETLKLPLPSQLVWQDVCVRPVTADGSCPKRSELFTPEQLAGLEKSPAVPVRQIEVIRPTSGLQIAYDPRIPADHQKFRFEVAGLSAAEQTEWILDGETLGSTTDGHYLWGVSKGRHVLHIRVEDDQGQVTALEPVDFVVK